ncbi:MAG: transglutaminase domain-containing protein [Bacteroidales bacterium]|nr:transglutaminase domain-containing protein [Bacteroidales bacterium]
MTKPDKYLLVALVPLLLVSCTSENLITDKSYRQKVFSDLENKTELFSESGYELFDISEQDLAAVEYEAMAFLYAYMPLSDIADYSDEFFLENARHALKTRNDYPWGRQIPGDVFLHYVLPPRVNNENMDRFRMVYYDELKDRLRGYETIEEAALEINHWCHEKVTYRAADIRTSGPMATILSARGRCGEESTFTVAAMRAAGIPARQIYTPRWAHSDDNHAWVEVWIDGDWKYLGACEPEPVLDRGWFTEPARRAMLTHTKAFGHYRGSEDLVREENDYAVVNTLDRYALTRVIKIIVLDAGNNTVEDAIVKPSLYNYAEFYPLAELRTKQNGTCLFKTGLGDLLVFAYHDGSFGFEKINPAVSDEVTVKLGAQGHSENYYEFALQPPHKRQPYKDTIPPEIKQLNAKLLEKEDSIRNSYIDSWISKAEVREFARSKDLDVDAISDIFERSMGNYAEMKKLFIDTPPVYHDKLLDLLNVISDKDLRDTRAEVLKGHLLNTVESFPDYGYDDEVFNSYVLNPRIANELIRPWREFIGEYFTDDQKKAFSDNPQTIADYLADSIIISGELNYYKVPVSPEGVLKTGHSDNLSLRILFVAVCRTLGIPSRLEPGTGYAEYLEDDKWHRAVLTEETANLKNAYLDLESTGPASKEPEYYKTFTLARFNGEEFRTLSYEYNKPLSSFRKDLTLPEGRYLLVTGNRTKTKVLSGLHFTELEAGKKNTIKVDVRENMQPLVPLQKINMKMTYEHNEARHTLEEKASKGIVMIWVDENKEPGRHLLRDFPSLKDEFKRIGCKFLFLADPVSDIVPEIIDEKGELPSKSIKGFDVDLKILSEVSGKNPGEVNLPLVIYAEEDGEVYYYSEGYHIGTAEQLLNNIPKK